MSRFFIRTSYIVFSFFLGLGIVYYSNSRFKFQRDPAAIRSVFDFSHLRGNALEVAVKERIISGLDVRKSAEGFGLVLGHFAYQTENGEKVLGCQGFSKVVLAFEAEGYAVSGEKTSLEVDGPCTYSSDLSQINPLMIPMARVLQEKPGDGDFNFQEGTPISLKFLNVPEAWPRKWVLVGVKMVSAQKEILIDRNEVAQILGHPLILSY